MVLWWWHELPLHVADGWNVCRRRSKMSPFKMKILSSTLTDFYFWFCLTGLVFPRYSRLCWLPTSELLAFLNQVFYRLDTLLVTNQQHQSTNDWQTKSRFDLDHGGLDLMVNNLIWAHMICDMIHQNLSFNSMGKDLGIKSHDSKS